MFSDFTCCLPGMSNVRGMKNHLVAIHVGKLYINSTTDHVDHVHNFFLNGLNPSFDNPNQMFLGSSQSQATCC